MKNKVEELCCMLMQIKMEELYKNIKENKRQYRKKTRTKGRMIRQRLKKIKLKIDAQEMKISYRGENKKCTRKSTFATIFESGRVPE